MLFPCCCPMLWRACCCPMMLCCCPLLLPNAVAPAVAQCCCPMILRACCCVQVLLRASALEVLGCNNSCTANLPCCCPTLLPNAFACMLLPNAVAPNAVAPNAVAQCCCADACKCCCVEVLSGATDSCTSKSDLYGGVDSAVIAASAYLRYVAAW